MTSKKCPHVKAIQNWISSANQYYGKKECCHSCSHVGSNQWLCLSPKCFYVGCGHKHSDHSSQHAKMKQHPIAVNLHNRKIFCHHCNQQVHLSHLMDPPSAEPSDSALFTPPNSTKVTQSINCNGNINDGNYRRINYMDDSKLCPHSVSAHSSNEERAPPSNVEPLDNSSYGLYEEPSPRNTCGLRNLGNTCYLNASLQALMFCHPLNHVFLDGPIIPSYPRRLNLAVIFQKLFQEMWCIERKPNDYRAIIPSQLVTVFRTLNPAFRSYAQQDAQEFIRLFVDRLHEELKEPLSRAAAEKCGGASLPLSVNIHERRQTHLTSSTISSCSSHIPRQRHASSRSSVGSNPELGIDKNKLENETLDYRSIISDIFRGVLRNTCECLECGFTSTSLEPFYDLSVPIFKSASSSKSSSLSNSASSLPPQNSSSWPFSYLSNNITDPYDVRSWISWFSVYIRSWFVSSKATLQDCLSLFFAEDNLHGDNQYFCERCNRLCDGVKRSAIEHLPETLCIHLKRFHHPNSPGGSTLAFSSFSDSLSNSSKLTDPIIFPLFGLDMSPYTIASSSSCKDTGASSSSTEHIQTREHQRKESPLVDCPHNIYDLSAVVCHLGSSGSHGHYITYALNHDMQQWFEIDDESVQPADSLIVSSMLSQAYVLFYKKNDDAILPLRDSACAIEQNDLAKSSFGKLLRQSVLPLYIDREWVMKFNSFSHPGLISNARLLCAKHQELLPCLQRRYASLTDPSSCIPLTDILLPISPDMWNFFRNTFSGGPAISSLHVCCKCQRMEEELNERRQKERKFVSNGLQELRHHGSHGNIYAIHMNWFNTWENFVNGADNKLPGAIMNLPMTDGGIMSISKGDVIMPEHSASLLESGNYCKVSESIWNYFFHVYGGGPAILIQTSASPSPKRPRELLTSSLSASEMDTEENNLHSAGDQTESSNTGNCPQ